MKREEFIKNIKNSIQLKKEEYKLVPAGAYIRYKKKDGSYCGGGIVMINRSNYNGIYENIESDKYSFLLKYTKLNKMWTVYYSDIEDLYKDTNRISMIELNRMKNNRSMSLGHNNSISINLELKEKLNDIDKKLSNVDKLDKELNTVEEFAKRTNKKIESLTKENKELEKEVKSLTSRLELLEKKLSKNK